MAEAKAKIREFIGTGRRKTAVASVRLREGSGKCLVNGKPMEEYFTLEVHRNEILSPLVKFQFEKKYDLLVRVKGGGVPSQAEAARLGVSRALVLQNEDFRSDLKDLGYLTRDPRKKERKKYGLAGARKSFQFSKR